MFIAYFAFQVCTLPLFFLYSVVRSVPLFTMLISHTYFSSFTFCRLLKYYLCILLLINHSGFADWYISHLAVLVTRCCNDRLAAVQLFSIENKRKQTIKSRFEMPGWSLAGIFGEFQKLSCRYARKTVFLLIKTFKKH